MKSGPQSNRLIDLTHSAPPEAPLTDEWSLDRLFGPSEAGDDTLLDELAG